MMTGQQFKISQLRQQKISLMLESLATFLFSVFVTAFLPQLLLRYYFMARNVNPNPSLFDFIQAAGFVIGVGYFIYAVVMSVMKSLQIKKLEAQTEKMMGMNECCDGCGEACACDDHGNCDCGSCEPKMMSTHSNSSTQAATSASAVTMMQKASGTKKKVNKKK
jgi:hypothetical protein